jgi:hypothetical protein
LTGDCVEGALAFNVDPSAADVSVGVGATGVAGLALQAYAPTAAAHTTDRSVFWFIQLLQVLDGKGRTRDILPESARA